MNDIPDSLKSMLSFDDLDSDFFSNIQLVNIKIKKESTLKELGYVLPAISRPAFNAALEKGHVTLPVNYGKATNEIYDVDGNYVCYLLEV